MIKQKKTPAQREAFFRPTFHRLCRAMCLLHRLGVVHRDLSLENIVGKDAEFQHPVIIDLGAAVVHPDSPLRSNLLHLINEEPRDSEKWKWALQAYCDLVLVPLEDLPRGEKEKEEVLECNVAMTIMQEIENKEEEEQEREQRLKQMVYNPTRLGMVTRAGKPNYISPEAYSHGAHDLFLNDSWTFGVTLYCAVTGHPPFQLPVSSDPWFQLFWSGAFQVRFANQTQQGTRLYYFAYSAEFIDLISHIFVPEAKRWRMEELVNHKWFRGAVW